MRLFVCRPRGFCAGVVRAIGTVEKALSLWGAPIYVKHHIVHNRHVVESLKKRGAIFVEDIKDIPKNSRVIFSAHGVSPKVRKEAGERGLFQIDATCNLVTKLHTASKKYSDMGYQIILIGNRKNIEVIGVFAEAPESTHIVESVEDVSNLNFSKGEKLFYITQTTLSIYDVDAIVSEIKRRYPHIESLKTSSICYATTNRQRALSRVLDFVDIVLVVGDSTSSNSNRLKEIAIKSGISAYLINGEDEIDSSWFSGVRNIGMTAGASTPEDIVKRSIGRLKEMGVNFVEEVLHVEENVSFPLPI